MLPERLRGLYPPSQLVMMTTISIDTETTGLDYHHGAEAFMVTIGYPGGRRSWWEWDVDPLTRSVRVDPDDLVEILQELEGADVWILQNSMFDAAIMEKLYRDAEIEFHWDWSKVRDTLLAAHLVNSLEPHDLTTLALVYLDRDIDPYDQRVREASKAARTWAGSNRPDWRRADKSLPEMPSAKGSKSIVKFDMWLPRAVAVEEEYPTDHPWWTVTSEYATVDTDTTYLLWQVQEEILRDRGLDRIYEERLRILPVIHQLQQRGVTLSDSRTRLIRRYYQSQSDQLGETCVSIAESMGHEITLPKSGNNNSLLEFAESETGLNLLETANPTASMDYGSGGSERVNRVGIISKKTGRILLNQDTMEGFILDREVDGGPAFDFLSSLQRKRKVDTSLSYLESYKRFGVPFGQGGYKVFTSLNPTATNTLRCSSSNPNSQNISKQKDSEGKNLRYAFGPAPGREWWSLDAENIELRLPAYDAGEQEMIDLFERPNDPPYYGSVHLLMFDTLHPDTFQEYGADVKTIFKDTWYQWTKNGDFAVQYGSVESSGTADRAYHVKGAFNQIKSRFEAIHGKGGLNQRCIEHAQEFGYIETMIDRNVDPERGYPLYCEFNNYGRVKPTVPLNYRSQGSAMWWMLKAMCRVSEYLETMEGYWMIMQVHDELVFDFPYRPDLGNLPKIRRIKRLMERSGDDFGVPTPVSVDYHPNNWAESEKVGI